MKSNPDISITIVNYNTCQDLQQCLQSVFNTIQKFKIEVFVVDNNSSDGSQRMVKNNFPQVKLISNKINHYFSKANNQGLAKSKSKYLLILAPDAILGPNTINHVIKFMNHHPDCGLATVRQTDKNNKTLLTCQRNHTPLTEIFNMPLWQKFFSNTEVMKKFRYDRWNRLNIRKVDTVPGAFMLIRKEVIDEIGLMDEKFKIFYSDTDLAVRVKSKGWKIFHFGLTSFIHLKARSIAKVNQNELLKIASQDKNHYTQKYLGSFWFLIIYLLGKINLVIMKVLVNSTINTF